MKNFLTRFLGGIFLIFLIGLITFFLFKALPGDAHADQIYDAYVSGSSRENAELQWKEYVEKQALDLPMFYFTISPRYVDKSASRIPLNSLYGEYVKAARNYKPTREFFELWKELGKMDISQKTYDEVIKDLKIGKDPSLIAHILSAEAGKLSEGNISSLLSVIKKRKVSYSVPVVYWHGSSNQFHFWLKQFIDGKLFSEKVNQPVYTSIWNALLWTLSINVPAFLLLFFVGAFLGGMKSLRDRALVRALEKVFYSFFSMPLFWLCTLMLTIAINWFPLGSFKILVGPFQEEQLSILSIYKNHFLSLYLPILCIFLHNTIYISRHVEQSIDSVKDSRYVLAARARGLGENTLLKRHILPNAARPIITLIPQLIPGLLAGSVITELIFNIPGMGRLFWDALMSRDWQMIFGLVIFISIVVYLSMWLADILYPKKVKIDAYD